MTNIAPRFPKNDLLIGAVRSCNGMSCYSFVLFFLKFNPALSYMYRYVYITKRICCRLTLSFDYIHISHAFRFCQNRTSLIAFCMIFCHCFMCFSRYLSLYKTLLQELITLLRYHHMYCDFADASDINKTKFLRPRPK